VLCSELEAEDWAAAIVRFVLSTRKHTTRAVSVKDTARSGSLLFREIKEQGYGGKQGTVLSYFVQVRKAQGIPQ
jgi:hypothetical protein